MRRGGTLPVFIGCIRVLVVVVVGANDGATSIAIVTVDLFLTAMTNKCLDAERKIKHSWRVCQLSVANE